MERPLETKQQIKQHLRKVLLQQRQALSPKEWREKSNRLCQNLHSLALFQTAQTILTYISVRQEPDLTALFTLEKTWGLPRCVGQQLVWHRWSPAAEFSLQVGKFGILEPHPDTPRLEATQVDLILVPALACDRQGYRLGYGGGFYDRMLSQPVWANKPAIAPIFDQALVPTLPVEPWDQPVSGICTESGWFAVPS